MRLSNANNSRRAVAPSFVYQCLPGQPAAQAKEASRLIGKWLKANGIHTKTFAAEALNNQEHSIQNLPHHRDFVLLLHDSGNETTEEFICLAGLEAPIVLLHYTVPVPVPSTRSPVRWAMATAALGMDPIATRSLRIAGFHDALSLIFPASDSVPHVVRNASECFGLVAPGDLTPESDAQILTCAFARMRGKIARPSKLIFMGRTLDAVTAKSVQDEIRKHDLQDAVTITGALDRAAESEIFAECDLGILLTKPNLLPEGLVQAATSGLAILAKAGPAAVHTLGETGLDANFVPSVEQLAERLIDLAGNAEHFKALTDAQQQHLAVARNDNHVAVTIWNALGRCGFSMPMSPIERRIVSEQLEFVVAGHFEGSYSIAAVNRLLALALEGRSPGSVSIVPVAFLERIDVLDGIPTEQSEVLERLFVRKQLTGAPVIAISQHFPPWKPDFLNDLALCLFTWEETLIPPEMVDMINGSFDGVMAVSRFVAKTLIDSGIRLPVRVVGQSLDAAPYSALKQDRFGQSQLSDLAPFTVLHVSSCFPRKGPDILLAAWAEAFNADDPVRLIIKSFPNPHHEIADDLERLRSDFPTLAPVELIDQDLGLDEMVALYRAAHCMLLPTRGEGFNMVAAEAMLAGLPLIVTGFGGHLDFLEPGDARLVAFKLENSASHVAAGGAIWAEPDLADVVAALREAFAAHRAGRSFIAPTSRAVGEAKFNAAGWADKVSQFATGLVLDAPQWLKRLAWISSWEVRCGIAEYSKALLSNRPGSALSTEIMLLCDTRTRNAVHMEELESLSVNPAWHFGEGRIAAEVETYLQAFDPQLLVIQHQDGLVSWEDLLELIKLARAANRRLIVILHSTEAILSLHHKLRASVLFGLTLLDRVVVHTLHDIENLRRLGLADNLTLLPHGASPLITAPSVQPRGGKIIGCYGFFLPHKGIAKLINAFAALRAEWPSARLRLVNAAFPSDVSADEIKSCHALARRLQVDDGIDWHTNYLDEQESKTLLAGCDLIVLPYDPTPESVSGAIRHALASGSPVAVSQSKIFTELGDAVHHIDADSADQLAENLAVLLRDPHLAEAKRKAAAEWIGRHEWRVLSKRFFHMMEGLCKIEVDRSVGRLVLPATQHLLETEIGKRTGRHIVYSGETSGFGLYGPYVNLIPGNYKIVYQFDPLTDLIGSARFEVYSQISEVSIICLNRIFAEAGPDHYSTELTFTLTQAVREVEFRMLCEASFQGALESLSIQLLNNA